MRREHTFSHLFSRCWLLPILLVLQLVPWSPASALDFFVDDPTDKLDLTIGDGLCTTSGGGCSLRAAVQESNAHSSSGPHVITLSPGVHTLGLVGADEDFAATGDLDLFGQIRLVGDAAETTVVDAAGLDRAFDVQVGALVEISNLTIRNGFVDAANAGGGIRFRYEPGIDQATRPAHLISDVVFTQNRAHKGGAIANIQRVVVLRSRFVENEGERYEVIPIPGSHSGRYSLPDGGAIENAALGVLTIRESEFEGNRLPTGYSQNEAFFVGIESAGGAISNKGSLAVADSFFSHNVGGFGGGIANRTDATAWLHRIEVAHSSATVEGGGIFNEGAFLWMNGSTLRDNVAFRLSPWSGPMYCQSNTAYGGGLSNNTIADLSAVAIYRNQGGQGGGVYSTGELRIANAGVYENAGDVIGGGILTYGESLEISETSVFDNTSRNSGGGLHVNGALTARNLVVSGNRSESYSCLYNVSAGAGGGMSLRGGPIHLLHTTVVNNLAQGVADPRHPPGPGGISASTSSGRPIPTIEIQNSIVAGNLVEPDPSIFPAITSPSNCEQGGRVPLVSGGGNVVDDMSCLLGDATDLEGVDPLIQPLADEGGFGPSHALQSSSPAIGWGVASACLEIDQRLRERPGSGCDSGAYERGASIAVPEPALSVRLLGLLIVSMVAVRGRARKTSPVAAL